MNYDDQACEQQQQEEESFFFHTLADVNQLIESFGEKTFFYHLFETYPHLKEIAKKYI